METYVILYRKLRQWEWYQDSQMVHLFIHLLLSANRYPGNWKGIDLETGQLITGLQSLRRDTGISTQSLRTCLNRLKSTGEVTIQSTNRYSLITVCKYHDYQITRKQESEINSPANKQSTNNQQTANKQSTTNNKGKEREKEREKEKNVPKGTQQADSRNKEVQEIIETFEESLLIPMDGTQKENRRYAYLFLQKLKKIAKEGGKDENEALRIAKHIIQSSQNGWHSKNATNLKYIYYNMGKIINETKTHNSTLKV